VGDADESVRELSECGSSAKMRVHHHTVLVDLGGEGVAERDLAGHDRGSLD
jgi:hypothetical protein